MKNKKIVIIGISMSIIGMLFLIWLYAFKKAIPLSIFSLGFLAIGFLARFLRSHFKKNLSI
jgi:hypothetical protein